MELEHVYRLNNLLKTDPSVSDRVIDRVSECVTGLILERLLASKNENTLQISKIRKWIVIKICLIFP